MSRAAESGEFHGHLDQKMAKLRVTKPGVPKSLKCVSWIIIFFLGLFAGAVALIQIAAEFLYPKETISQGYAGEVTKSTVDTSTLPGILFSLPFLVRIACLLYWMTASTVVSGLGLYYTLCTFQGTRGLSSDLDPLSLAALSAVRMREEEFFEDP